MHERGHPLQPADAIGVDDGYCVTFVAPDHPPFAVAFLDDMLRDPLAWDVMVMPPGIPGQWIYVLTDDEPLQFLPPPAGTVSDRLHLAAVLDYDADRMVVQRARPNVWDHFDFGIQARGVMIVSQEVQRNADSILYILDMRPIMCGLTWGVARAGRVPIIPIVDRMRAVCPPDYRPVLSGGVPLAGSRPPLVIVEPGAVLTVTLVRCDTDERGTDLADDSSDSSGSSSGEPGPPDEMSSPGAAAARPTASDSDHTRDPQLGVNAARPGGNRANMEHTWCHFLLRATSRHAGPVQHPSVLSPSRVAMWTSVLCLGALLLGHRWFTSFLLVALQCHNMGGLVSLSGRPGQHTVYIGALVLCLCVQPALAVKTGQSAGSNSVALAGPLLLAGSGSALPAHLVKTCVDGRVLPTPCRAGARTARVEKLHTAFELGHREAEGSSSVGDSVASDNNPGVLEDLTQHTLLAVAARQPDCSAFAVASALLEVLFEAFPVERRATNASADQQSGVTALQLDSLIPEQSSGLFGLFGFQRLQCLRLSGSNAPSTQLSIGATPLGFSLAEVQEFLGADPCGSDWEATLAEHESLLGPWAGLLQGMLSEMTGIATAIDVWVYTDGSFTPGDDQHPERMGWACVFLHPAAAGIFCASGLVPAFLENFSPGTSQGSAYVAESSALLAAALISIAALVPARVHFMSDCQAAIHVAAGENQTTMDGIAAAAAAVHALRRQLFPDLCSYGYVPGHAGNAANEVADGLSKHAARHSRASCGLCVDQIVASRWLGKGACLIPWVALVIRSLSGDCTLPPINTADLGHDWDHAGMSASDILGPFVPHDAVLPAHETPVPSEPADEPRVLQLRIVTFNVLSLLDGVSDRLAEGTGLHMQPGRAALLAMQLEQAGVSIALLQETRCPQGSYRAGNFLRYASGDVRGQWSCEVWLRNGFSFVTCGSRKSPVRSFSAQQVTVLLADPRRLVLRVCAGSFCLVVACLHGPHRATEGPSIDNWWRDTRKQLRHLCKGEALICGGDFNASLGSEISAHVGAFASEAEDTAGQWVHKIAAEMDLWIPCTFETVHKGPSHTYCQKKSGKLLRPDFVMIPMSWGQGHVESWTEPSVHAGHVVQDHTAAAVDACILFASAATRGPSAPPRIRAEDILDPANKDRIRDILASAPKVPWSTSAHAHAALVTRHVQVGLDKLRRDQPRRARHPYLSGATFELQQAAAKIRHSLHSRQHRKKQHCLAECFRIWRDRSGDFEQAVLGNAWIKQLQLLISANSQQLAVLSRALRRSCRSDRAVYIADLADRVSNGPSNDVFAEYHRLLSHRRKRPYQPEPLPIIRNAKGELCTGAAEATDRWREHFGSLEAGRRTSFADLAAKSLYPEQAFHQKPWPHPSGLEQVPSFLFLQQVLAGTKTAKAPGLDRVPPELCKSFSADTAAMLFPILLKHAWRGCEPIGWKGGRSVFFYKQKGSVQECASYRAVLLLSTFAKACHKSLRPSLKLTFEQTSPQLQLGGRRGCSVTFGAHVIRSVMRWADHHQKTAYTIFADIAAAFYGAVTQLVASVEGQPAEALINRLTEQLQLSAGDVEALKSHLQDPSALQQLQASPWIEALTSRMCCQNWFVLKHDREPVSTARGTRPGSSFADVIFALLIPRVLRHRDMARSEELGHCASPRLRWDGRISLEACPADSGSIDVGDVVWADDIAVPRVCETPMKARAAIAAETGALTDAFSQFGLRLAYGVSKTASVVSVRGPGSRQTRNALFAPGGCNGEVPLLREHATRASIPLVGSYRHLGVMQAPFGGLGPELRYRISQAAGAFKEGRRKIYKNRDISVRRKGQLLCAVVLAKLLQGAGSWPPLLQGEQRTFDATVWRYYRAILCIPRDSTRSEQSLTGLMCCAITGLSTPAVLLRRERLLYLRQMTAAGPDSLWALVRADRPYAELLRSDLAWLFEWNCRVLALDHPDRAWQDWVAFMTSRPGAYKGAVKRACALDHLRIEINAALDGLFRGLESLAGLQAAPPLQTADSEFPEICLPCKRAFASRVSWSGHAARKHGYRSRAFLVSAGSLCLACGKQFSSDGRLRRHLVSVPACLAGWGTFVADGDVPSSVHDLAPPCQVRGRRCSAPLLQADPHVSDLLLEQLTACQVDDEEAVWKCIEDTIVPLAVLRATVCKWRDTDPNDLWRAGAAENALLLLDPAVTAEVFPRREPRTRVGPYDTPEWGTLGGLVFVSDGVCLQRELLPPPSVALSLSSPTSMPVRQARGLATWTEAACRVLAECAEAAKRRPVQLYCPGIWAPFQELRIWTESLGFLCDHSGMRSP